MKKLIALTIGALFLTLSIGTALADQKTNTVPATVSYIMEPFPMQFDGMVSTNRFPGMWPVAIYYCSDNKTAFACAGLAFQSDADGGHTLIAPEHLFEKGVNYAYAIRIAHPGNHRILGYIDQITSRGKDNKGLDIVLASIGPKPKVIDGYFCGKAKPARVIPSSEVTIGQKTVKRITSYITEDDAVILGRECDGEDNGKVSSIVVETKACHGYSCSPFYDEYGRFYFMEASTTNGDPSYQIVNRQFKEQFHRDMNGIAYLVGPVELN